MKLHLRYALILSAMLAAIPLLARRADAQLRVMTYNISNIHPITAAPAASNDLAELQKALQASGLEVLNGVSRPVDVFLIQEVDENGADEIQQVTDQLNALYGAGTYARSHNVGIQGTSTDDTQMLIYNTKTVQLIAGPDDSHSIPTDNNSPISPGEKAIGTGHISDTEIPRSPIRYRLRPKAPAGVAAYTSSADFYAYNSHYKASDDSTSANRRNIEAQQIHADSNALGSGVRAIYAGDFNIYRSTEAMWGTLTAAGNGQAVDPLNRIGNWHNSSSFADVDTQSSVLTSRFSGQANGGLDDRFDWQMVTAPLLSNTGMSLLSGSYHAVGNSGTQHPFNQDLDYTDPMHMNPDLVNDDPIQGIIPGQNMLTVLARTSEHLPVVAQYKVPAIMGTAVAAVASQVIVNASLSTQVSVSNVAGYNANSGTNSGNDLVSAPVGADTLSYSVTASGAASGSANASGLAAASMAASTNTHNFGLSTGTAGAKSASFTINTTTPQVPNPSQMLSVNYTVLDHANASFTTPADNDSLSINFGSFVQASAAQPIAFSINNLAAPSGFTAGLDLLNVGGTGSTSALTTNLAAFANLMADAPGNSFQASFDTTNTGNFSATYTLNLSDDSTLLGHTAQQLTLNLSGVVVPEFMPGDFDRDHQVTAGDIHVMMDALTDLHAYQMMKGLTDPQLNTVANLNGEGGIDNLDAQALLVELANASAGGGGITAVPEPSALVLFALGAAAVVARRRRGYRFEASN